MVQCDPSHIGRIIRYLCAVDIPRFEVQKLIDILQFSALNVIGLLDNHPSLDLAISTANHLKRRT